MEQQKSVAVKIGYESDGIDEHDFYENYKSIVSHKKVIMWKNNSLLAHLTILSHYFELNGVRLTVVIDKKMKRANFNVIFPLGK